MVMGITRCGGEQSPFFPQTAREPFDTLSIIVRDMKSSRSLQLLLFGRIILGGVGLLYFTPLNSPLKGFMKSKMETPSVRYLMISSLLWYPSKTKFQDSK